MKKIALLLNSPYLGGAERSVVHQSSLLKESAEITYHIPILKKNKDGAKELQELIESVNPKGKIRFYNYPFSLFEVSRSTKLKSMIKIVVGLIALKVIFFSMRLRKYDTIWANGNKVGFTSLLFARVVGFKGRLIWHFRDYPVTNSYYRIIWPLVRLKKRFELFLVGNSFSVSSELEKLARGRAKIITLYNPVGESITKKTIEKDTGFNIGVVSMLAPWKGIHQIILWASLYEDELKELGVNKVKIFGGSIYQTQGEHGNYENELRALHGKFPTDLIEFSGIKSPHEIYADIDLLIHPSIKPEPFGRIIVEGFKANIPVISTALGGASELIEHQKNGVRFFPYDYSGLFLSVKNTLNNRDLCKRLFTEGDNKLGHVEKMLSEGIQEIL